MSALPALRMAAARHARGGIELLVQLLEWAPDPVLSRAVDRLLQLEEEPGDDAEQLLDAVETDFGGEIAKVVRQLRTGGGA